ncbi:MAG: alpha/beta hydrolase [SAR202 cluster bacterium]|nr:alpha/beta hydrolase [SAR202 cluster bacterium]
MPGRSDTTLLWFHGNAGNIANPVDNLGVGVFIFDYRGYVRSEDKSAEEGTYLDAEAALEYLHSRGDVHPWQLVLFSRSLGCAVAAELASTNDVQGVVLESPFTSIRAMAKRAYPFLPGIGSFVRTRYDTLSKVGRIGAPLMVLHGDRDDIAPFDMGVAVFEATTPPKRFYRIERAGHNDTYSVGGHAYYQALGEFLDSLPQGDA